MTTSTFHVSDMHCASCETRIVKALQALPGVARVRAHPVRRELFVDHDQQQVPVLQLFGRLEELGFTPRFEDEADVSELHTDIKRLGIAGIAMMQVVMQAIALYVGHYQGMAAEHVYLLQAASFIFCLPVILYSAQPFYRNAWFSIRAVTKPRDLLTGLSMDVPVALAISIAFVASTLTLIKGEGEVYFDSVVMFTFLLLIARFIDARVTRRRDSASALSLLPDRCIRTGEGGDESVLVSELQVGDRILVRPGDRIVADGQITTGSAHINEALLTGESDTVERGPGQPVTAGTLNCYQAFEFEVTRAGSDTRLAKIEALALASIRERPPVVLRANRVASYFVAAMLLFAGATALVWLWFDPAHALRATIAVLVVSCPCALALATPAAITAALSKLQGRGVVVQKQEVLETAATIRAVALDKTGTLTTGKLWVESTECFDNLTEDECLQLAAGLERVSDHPIARAFHHISPMTVSDIRIEAMGVVGTLGGAEARIGTWRFCAPDAPTQEDEQPQRTVYLSVNQTVMARFRLGEEWRQDVAEILQSFRQTGIEPILLSGDSYNNCRRLNEYLTVKAELSPEEKREQLLAFRARFGPVLMLGDGINDLPALATADLAAVVLEAPDVVKANSDVVLLSRQLTPIYELLRVARATRQVIRQNIAWALLYNLTMIPLAASGVLLPWMAALGMSLSSLLVVLNSTRLQR